MRTTTQRCASVCGLVVLVAGCASEPPRVAEATDANKRKAEDCLRVTGSNVCRQLRAGGLTGTDNTTIITGDAVRRSGAPVAGPEAMKIE